jgi:hypothetical protein
MSGLPRKYWNSFCLNTAYPGIRNNTVFFADSSCLFINTATGQVYTATEQVYKTNRFVLSGLVIGETILIDKCFPFITGVRIKAPAKKN